MQTGSKSKVPKFPQNPKTMSIRSIQSFEKEFNFLNYVAKKKNRDIL